MASQELPSRPTCDSTPQMRLFFSQVSNTCDPQSFLTLWVLGWVPPAKDFTHGRHRMQSSNNDLTDNSDHPHEYVRETRDPHSWHEEGYHVPFLPEPSSAVRCGQEKQSDDGQRQNPEDPLQVALRHGEHTFMLCRDASRQTCLGPHLYHIISSHILKIQ